LQTTGIKYDFNSKPWKYTGPASWTFISLPEAFSREIRDNLRNEEEGWGRLKATVKIGNTEWKTAIWFDTKTNTYLLPLKAAIRKTENIEIDKDLAVTIWV
jgi:hypothetical protein